MTLSGPIFPRKGKGRKITDGAENSHFSLLLTILGVAEKREPTRTAKCCW